MDVRPKNAALVLAAGRGQRAGGPLPKQWQRLSGVTIAERSVAAFATCPEIDLVALVLHPDEMERAEGVPDCLKVAGGASRAASVRAGLEALAPHRVDTVLIHDGARPLVSQTVIRNVLRALQTHSGAAPALAVTDALWRGTGQQVSGTQDRAGLYRAQTPQGFRFADILAAHRTHQGNASDDVEVARAAGLDVAIVPGEERNLKITWAQDFERAEALLGGTMDIRMGNGFDVHRFCDGDHVVLCGVSVPHERGLAGHSDADVGMHALTDAIYGALAEGDIGQHFPPSDPQWKGADSAIFLRHAVALAARHGFRLGNADITLICERPKIGPHSAAMRARLAEIIETEPTRISVKATTSETLGFTGRGEGIAALASATLVGA